MRKSVLHAVTFLVTIFACFPLAAQEFELGNVTKEELLQKNHPSDPEAEAAVLFEKGHSYFAIQDSRWVIVTEVKKRIKIYSKEGAKYADVSVPYYMSKGIKENVVFSDAITYNLSGDAIVKTKLDKAAVFVRDISKTRKVKWLIMPNVVEGSVIEYRYVIKSPYIFSIPEWYFQSRIPVNSSEYTVAIPQMFDYNLIKNKYLPIREKSEVKKGSARLGDGGISFSDYCVTYSVANMPAFRSEAYIDNPQNYMPYVKHELASATDLDGKIEKYTTDWSTVISTISKEDSFGDELKKKSYFEEGLQPLLQGKKDEKDIINIVFTYVKNRMAWNKKYGYDCSDDIKKAYAARTGNVGEINLMLTAMLRYAGLKANPVLLSTRENGHVSYMSIASFNYVIAGVETMDGIVLLDATDKNAAPGVLPIRAVNVTGRLVRDDMSSQEVSLLPEKLSKKTVVITADIAKDGTLSGKVQEKFQDYEALFFKDTYHDTGIALYTDNLEKQFNAAEISNLVVEEGEITSQEFTFVSKNECDVADGRMYIEPMLFYTLHQNPFREDQRLYPVDFMYPHQKKYIYYINIPEGYAIEYIPAPLSLAALKNIGTFKFNVANDGNQIQVVVTKNINYAMIDAEYYAPMKEFYTGIVNKQAEKIILKRI